MTAVRARMRRLCSSVEGDVAVGVVGGPVVGVVGAGVVPGAQGDAVGEVGVAAVGPALLVVGVQAGGAVAALGAAAAVADQHGGPLGLGEQPPFAAHVEGLGVAVEDDGDDPGLAGEPPGQGG